MIGPLPIRLRAAIHGRRARDAVRIVYCGCIAACCVFVAHAMGIVLCPLKRFFGVPCPTCGLTRAIVLLLRFDLRGAFEIQPLATSLICLLPLLTLVSCVALGMRRARVVWGTMMHSRVLWFLFAVAVIVNWVYVLHRGN